MYALIYTVKDVHKFFINNRTRKIYRQRNLYPINHLLDIACNVVFSVALGTKMLPINMTSL